MLESKSFHYDPPHTTTTICACSLGERKEGCGVLQEQEDDCEETDGENTVSNIVHISVSAHVKGFILFKISEIQEQQRQKEINELKI